MQGQGFEVDSSAITASSEDPVWHKQVPQEEIKAVPGEGGSLLELEGGNNPTFVGKYLLHFLNSRKQ